MKLLTNFYLHELSHAIGWTLIHSMWQTTVIGGSIWLLFQFVSKDNARIRYALSGLGLILVCVASAITFYRYLPSNTSVTVSDFTTQIKTIGFAQDEESFFTRLCTQLQVQLEHTFPYLVNIWMIGMLFLSINLILKYIHTLKLKKHLTYPLRSNYKTLADRLVLKYNLKQNILFKESGLLDIPSVIGYFKPVVLLPVSMLSGIPENQLEIIIAHELAHIRRHDYLLQFIQGIIELIFFYHPVVWWLSSVVNAEREHICDDLAVKVCGESLTLIKALNNMEAIRKKQYELVLGFSGKKGKVLNRIKRILRPKISMNPRRERFMLSGVFTLLFAGLFLISNFAISENIHPQKAFVSKINILDKTTDQAEKTVDNKDLTPVLISAQSNQKKKKKKDENKTEVVALELDEVTEPEEITKVAEIDTIEEATEVEEMELMEIPPIPTLVDLPINSFNYQEFNFPKDSVKSEKWVKMKTNEIIKKQLEAIKSAENEINNMKIDLDVDQMRKDLQEGLKDIDSHSDEIEGVLKEQIDIDKELFNENYSKEFEKELENQLQKIDENSELSKKEKEKIKIQLKESLEQIYSTHFQNKQKEHREHLQGELRRIQSPEFKEEVNKQILESKKQIQEYSKRINSDEYRRDLEERIKKSSITKKGLIPEHASINDPDKQPLIILDDEKITRAQMDEMSPDTFASVSVLKDHSAVKLYGEEAKNGVILITTKSQDSKNKPLVKIKGATINNPLYIVDGKRISAKKMEKINPDRIESITVVKSKQATEKYGEKAKNGVVLIQLKK